MSLEDGNDHRPELFEALVSWGISLRLSFVAQRLDVDLSRAADVLDLGRHECDSVGKRFGVTHRSTFRMRSAVARARLAAAWA